MLTIGTSHFVDLLAARLYYRPYGLDHSDVDRKLKDGEIHIGQPALKPGQRLSVIPSEGRYQITEVNP